MKPQLPTYILFATSIHFLIKSGYVSIWSTYLPIIDSNLWNHTTVVYYHLTISPDQWLPTSLWLFSNKIAKVEQHTNQISFVFFKSKMQDVNLNSLESLNDLSTFTYFGVLVKFIWLYRITISYQICSSIVVYLFSSLGICCSIGIPHSFSLLTHIFNGC